MFLWLCAGLSCSIDDFQDIITVDIEVNKVLTNLTVCVAAAPDSGCLPHARCLQQLESGGLLCRQLALFWMRHLHLKPSWTRWMRCRQLSTPA